jgi:hypothetical protein
LRLSLTTTLISLAIVVVLGTPLAWLVSRRNGRLVRLVETFMRLPAVLPPAVAGVALLLAFGRRGLMIKEYGGDKYFFKMYDKAGQRPDVDKRLGTIMDGDGVPFHGRGFVQLTGRYNYAYWQKRLGIDLTSSRAAADRVLDADVATRILFGGMVDGTFTGKKLADYFAGVREDWEGARKIINGNDKKALIAAYGRSYYGCISYTT